MAAHHAHELIMGPPPEQLWSDVMLQHTQAPALSAPPHVRLFRFSSGAGVPGTPYDVAMSRLGAGKRKVIARQPWALCLRFLAMGPAHRWSQTVGEPQLIYIRALGAECSLQRRCGYM